LKHERKQSVKNGSASILLIMTAHTSNQLLNGTVDFD